MFKFFVFCSILVAALASLSVRPDQTIGVRGTLHCNGKAASGVLVKLYDHDSKHI